MGKPTIPCLKLPPLTLYGSSVAGIATSLVLKELSLCFDVANGWEFLTPIKNILLSHGHMDHAGGLPYLLSQKSMTSQPKVNVYMPESLVEPMEKIVQQWSAIEEHEYNYKFIACELEKAYELKNGWRFRPFKTHHRIQSNGYTVFQTKKRLKKEFKKSSRKEILAAKDQGIAIEELEETPLVSFTGDTKIEFLDGPDWVRKSKHLICEVSFLDDRRTVEEARTWGHIHLDELIENYHKFEGEQLILIHMSKRYRLPEAREIIDEKMKKKGLSSEKVLILEQLSL